MSTSEILTPDQLDRATPALLKLLLQTGDKGYQDSIDAFDPPPSAANNWLRGDDGAFAGVFIDNQPNGAAKRVKFRITKGADGWESETELETGTIDQSETHDYRAIVDSIIPYQDVNIGVQQAPGSVRFPRAAYAKKLRCGYGHLRGHYQDGRSLKGFINPSLLNGDAGGKLWLLLQDDGETAQTKFMAGWDDKEGAIAAYAQEMPSDWLMDVWEATPEKLQEFRRSEFGESVEGVLEFAAGQPRKCKPTSVACGKSCQRAGSKCKNKPSPEGEKGLDLASESVSKAKGKKPKAEKKPKKEAKPATATKKKAARPDQKQAKKELEKDASSSIAKQKPLMSESEANDYTQDSVYKDRVFFHGTSDVGAEAITTQGVDPDKNTTAVYGKGFYVGGGKDGWKIGTQYADKATEFEFDDDDDDPFGDPKRKTFGTVLEMKINAKNPYIATSSEYFTEMKRLEDIGLIDSSNQRTMGDQITKHFKSQGYDAIEITDRGYISAFDASQVAIYKKHKNTENMQPPDTVQAKLDKEK